jgi:hypothetical protein
MSPNEHDNVWFGAEPVTPHVPCPPYAGLIDQLTPLPPGSGSSSVTDRATPGPEFPTTTVNPMLSPALTVASSAALLIVRCGARTTIVAESCTDPVFEADAVAVFGYVPALAAVVALAMWTEIDAPGAMSPNEHDNVWLGAVPVIEHDPGPAYGGAIDQSTPLPPGSGSFNVTAFAVPVPAALEFDTVIEKPIGSPVFTGEASAVFVIASAGQSTVVDALACTFALFVAWALAVFSYAAQLCALVALVTCTEIDAPGTISPNEQLNVFDTIEHVPGPAYAGLIDQLIPVPVGNGSESVTDFATPVPAAPEFDTVIVNPIGSPALTVGASAVFVIARFGHLTVVDALACTLAWLLACALAVFAYVAQLWAVVALVTCTEIDAPETMSPNEQLNVFDTIEHVPGPAYAGLIDQLTPAPVGNGSESVTDFAVPAPEFPIVIVKPMLSPAFTDAASASLSIVSAGQLTVVDADACTEPVLEADAVASLG